LPCFGGGKEVECAQQHGTGDGRGEDNQPNGDLAADLSAREFDRRGAQAEPALLRKSAKNRADHRAADQKCKIVAEMVSQKLKVHGITPMRPRTPYCGQGH
jgi:hypothetical protein